VHILRQGFLVVAALGLGRLAEAAQIRSNHRVRLGQLGDERPPHVTGLRVAMQQQHRLALAGGEVVQLGAVDLGKAAVDGSCLLSHHGSWVGLEGIY
jgi:hypothetical protein